MSKNTWGVCAEDGSEGMRIVYLFLPQEQPPERGREVDIVVRVVCTRSVNGCRNVARLEDEVEGEL